MNENLRIAVPALFRLNDPIRFLNDYVHIICVTEGNLTISCSAFSHRMRQGDILMLTDAVDYTMTPGENTYVLETNLDPIFFYEEFHRTPPIPECNSMLYPSLNYNGVRAALVQLAIDYHAGHTENLFLQKHNAYGLMHQLKALHQSQEALFPSSSGSSVSLDEKKKKFHSYISEHFDQNISLSDAAGFMKYTPQYLSSFLKKNFGLTFLAYLNRYRLERSLPYLKYRSYPLSIVSAICGFPGTAAFEKVFQEQYGTSPEQYRQSFEPDDITHREGVTVYQDASFIQDYLHSHFSYRQDSPSSIYTIEKRSVVCDVRHTVPLSPKWSEIINLGAASNFRRHDFVQQVRKVQQTVHFRYGRISDLIGLCHVEKAPGRTPHFNFTDLFSVLDTMIDLGLTPFLDLGDKSPNLHRSESAPFLWDPKEYDTLFPAFLPAMLTSCVLHYGLLEVSSWRFELWMRYHELSDLDKIEDPADYCSRFGFFLDTIRHIVPGACVGGPGFNTVLNICLFDDLLKEMNKRSLHPDFFTAYIFPYMDFDSVLRMGLAFKKILSGDPDFFRSRLSAMRKSLRENGFSDCKLYITEFSSHLGYRNHLNDSMYQALFITKHVLDNLDLADGFGYWVISDLLMSFNGSGMFLFGGNGLLTREGLPKPGLFAYAFMSRLGDRLVGRSPSCLITSVYPDEYRILIWHYVHFNSNFCNHPERYELQKYSDGVFQNSVPFLQEICLEGVSSGTYRLTRFLLNAENGSIFHEWSRQLYLSDFSPDEISNIAGSCSPQMSHSILQVAESIELSEQLNRNEICLILLQKL